MIGKNLVELSCSQENVHRRQTDIMITIPLVLPRGKNHSLTTAKKHKLKKRKLDSICEQASSILDKSLKLDSDPLNSTLNTPTSSGLVPTDTFDELHQAKMFKTFMDYISLKT